MRPIDLKGNAHPWYDLTLNQDAGAPLLFVEDYTAVAAAGSAVYAFLRNGLAIPPLPGPGPLVPGSTTVHSVHVPAPRNLGVPNRTNTGNVVLNPRIVRVEYHTLALRFMRLRVLLPALEAAEVVRLADEDGWNGTGVLAAAGAPAGLGILLRTRVTHRGTVPANGPPQEFYGYRGAVRDLTTRLGRYCSYCEARWQDGVSADVEHRAAKASYRSEYLEWGNFLVACVACNQRFKGDDPDRIFGIAQAAGGYHPPGTFAPTGTNAAPVSAAGNRLPYHDILRAANEFHIWPDLDDGGTTGAPFAANPANPTSLSLRCMGYRMREYNALGAPVGWIADADAVRLENVATGPGGNNTVLAQVWDPAAGALAPKHVRVEVQARNPLTANAAFNARKTGSATRTITMLGLNSQAGPFGDARVEARTLAWFEALEMLSLLSQQLATLQAWQNSWRITRLLRWGRTPPVVDFSNQMWNLVCSAAEGGYYSVWIHVFKHFGQTQLGDSALAVQLAQRLHNRATAPAATAWRYHGTNLVNSVANQIPHL